MNQPGTGIRKLLNADAGSIDLDADAQLPSLLSRLPSLL
jgi:hypothetical protein